MPNRRTCVAVLLAVGALTLTGCDTHRVALTSRCLVAKHTATVVVVGPKHKAGLAKIGLTPVSLKAQQDCH